mmetsp:Transcript_105021/g.321833  ORF Transcript_105021/g.321833 Transcript_105021/m.321833 type:complete len:289 (-) Transcript_105021:1859-2725(-)
MGLPHFGTAAASGAGSAAAPPRVGKSSAEPLYSSAFFLVFPLPSPFGRAEVDASFCSNNSMMAFSALVTSASMPLISTVASWIDTWTLHDSRMARTFVPRTRPMSAWSRRSSLTTLSAWSFSLISVKLAHSFFTACTSAAEPTTDIWPPLSMLSFTLSLASMSLILAPPEALSALTMSSDRSTLSTEPSLAMTSSIWALALSSCASSPFRTSVVSLRRTSAPETFSICASVSLLKTLACSGRMLILCGTRLALSISEVILALRAETSSVGPASMRPSASLSVKTFEAA